jgi:hypothetical protein
VICDWFLWGNVNILSRREKKLIWFADGELFGFNFSVLKVKNLSLRVQNTSKLRKKISVCSRKPRNS